MFVIWGAMLFAQFLFLVVGYSTKPALLFLDPSKPVLGADPMPTMILIALAFIMLVGSFVVKKNLIAGAVGRRDVAALQSAYVVGMAMAESISLIGLVAAFVFDYQYFAGFIVLGMIAIALHYPKMSSILAATFRDKLE
ncbi:MAG: hypothetical protein UZ17_ACD001002589 [Acidobacteria bacterium OLB17]|nr:MAG: hypothetical protein UZ17_ACD001002589 [Acidobacteria bacterium OLB17]